MMCGVIDQKGAERKRWASAGVRLGGAGRDGIVTTRSSNAVGRDGGGGSSTPRRRAWASRGEAIVVAECGIATSDGMTTRKASEARRIDVVRTTRSSRHR